MSWHYSWSDLQTADEFVRLFRGSLGGESINCGGKLMDQRLYSLPFILQT